jgi:hypothetical protein
MYEPVLPKKHNYGMFARCPWGLSSFTYGGLCSHSSLRDPIRGNYGFTAAELFAIDATNRERKRLHYNEYSVEYRKRQMATDPETRLGKERAYVKTYRENNREKSNDIKDRSKAKTKASARYRCDLCRQNCVSQWELDRHDDSKDHKKRVAKVARGVSFDYICHLCDWDTDVKGSLTRHLAGKAHQAIMAELTS